MLIKKAELIGRIERTIHNALALPYGDPTSAVECSRLLESLRRLLDRPGTPSDLVTLGSW